MSVTMQAGGKRVCGWCVFVRQREHECYYALLGGQPQLHAGVACTSPFMAECPSCDQDWQDDRTRTGHEVRDQDRAGRVSPHPDTLKA